MCSTVSAAPAASMPASSPTRSASATVLIHPYSGVLSAYGMGLADIRATRNRAVMKTGRRHRLDLAGDEAVLEEEAVRRSAAARASPTRRSSSSSAPTFATRAPTRRSRSTILDTIGGRGRPRAACRSPAMIAAFEAAHRKQFGFVFDGKPICRRVPGGRGDRRRRRHRRACGAARSSGRRAR